MGPGMEIQDGSKIKIQGMEIKWPTEFILYPVQYTTMSHFNLYKTYSQQNRKKTGDDWKKRWDSIQLGKTLSNGSDNWISNFTVNNKW